MEKTTLLAFGLVVIATIQINAAPSPTAPVAKHGDPTYSGVGKCVTTTKTKADSNHPYSKYQQAALDLKDWVEKNKRNPNGERALLPNGNKEECLPQLTPGLLDTSLTDTGGKPIYRNSYIEGYVPFPNAQLDNRGKGDTKVPNSTGKGPAFPLAPFPGGQDDGAARVILKIENDGRIGPNWWYTIGHYRPGSWSDMQTF